MENKNLTGIANEEDSDETAVTPSKFRSLLRTAQQSLSLFKDLCKQSEAMSVWWVSVLMGIQFQPTYEGC